MQFEVCNDAQSWGKGQVSGTAGTNVLKQILGNTHGSNHSHRAGTLATDSISPASTHVKRQVELNLESLAALQIPSSDE